MAPLLCRLESRVMNLEPAIVSKLGAPAQAVSLYWPLIVAGLEEFGINTPLVQVAAAATVMVETGRFAPIKERHADALKQPALWKLQERYYPTGYYGRGFVQLTWRDNYQRAGAKLGIDLLSKPDLALDPTIAARLLALYFKENGVADAAESRDWRAVRRLVNGGYHGWDAFNTHVCALLEVIGE